MDVDNEEFASQPFMQLASNLSLSDAADEHEGYQGAFNRKISRDRYKPDASPKSYGRFRQDTK